jgi:hypothetical protein
MVTTTGGAPVTPGAFTYEMVALSWAIAVAAARHRRVSNVPIVLRRLKKLTPQFL